MISRESYVLLALLSLLALANSASAECAWVLWSDNRPTDGFKTYEACKEAEDTITKKLMNSKMARDKILSMLPTCLPDTVDPRAPKGK